jgi:hypothetical protein
VNKSALVLSIPHQLQGPHFRDFVDDNSYRLLIKSSLSCGVSFIFEEASGHRPTIAEEMATSHLGANHYLDVDPSRDERRNLGIEPDTQDWFPIDPSHSTDVCYVMKIDEHRKREKLWLQQIQAHHFEKCMLVCGIAHGLSMAFRLVDAGFTNVELQTYVPFPKLGSNSVLNK